MNTATGSLTSSPNPAASPDPNRRQRFLAFLVRGRIRISVIIFALLIAEDVLEGLRPHDLLNFQDMMTMLGPGLVFAGLALRSWAAGILHKRTQLTTDGPYALIRHPLYVGSFLMMVGFCTLIDDAENIYFVLGPFVVLYILHILSEERKLACKFGERWQTYAGSVPRFVPRQLPNSGTTSWSLGQWRFNREYQAVGATLLGLAAIEAWQSL